MLERMASADRPSSAPTAQKRNAPQLNDLIVPTVPGLITSLSLQAVESLSGLQKIGVASFMGVVLWWLLRGRHEAKRGDWGAQVKRHWRWALLALACLTVLAVVVTAAVYGRPTLRTATVTVTVLAVLVAAAYGGRRVPGAVAGAVAGGVLGLCLGIVVQ
jgi:hypothetical protein